MAKPACFFCSGLESDLRQNSEERANPKFFKCPQDQKLNMKTTLRKIGGLVDRYKTDKLIMVEKINNYRVQKMDRKDCLMSISRGEECWKGQFLK